MLVPRVNDILFNLVFVGYDTYGFDIRWMSEKSELHLFNKNVYYYKNKNLSKHNQNYYATYLRLEKKASGLESMEVAALSQSCILLKNVI